MQIHEPWKRLHPKHFYFHVDQAFNRRILNRLEGTTVLDLGSGYGSLVHFLNAHHKKAIGIDSDPASIQIACELYPQDTYLQKNFQGAFPSEAFDHIVLKDSLHHLFEETAVEVYLEEIKRVLRKSGTLLIFDPNVQWVLKLCRKIMRHHDAECKLEDAVSILEKAGFEIKRVEFFDFFALAASGGYVGIPLVPAWPWLYPILLSFNRVLSWLICRMNLGRCFLWRYSVLAQKKN